MPDEIAITSFRSIIGLWASPGAMASEIGATVSAARKWHQRDGIPAEWWNAVLSAPRVVEAGVTAATMAQLAAREPAEART